MAQLLELERIFCEGIMTHLWFIHFLRHLLLAPVTDIYNRYNSLYNIYNNLYIIVYYPQIFLTDVTSFLQSINERQKKKSRGLKSLLLITSSHLGHYEVF